MQTIIVRNIIRWLTPFILAYGAYVVAYGHISPGGGFAGGSILAAGLILDRFAFGTDRRGLNTQNVLKGISGGLFIYGAIKGYSFLMGKAAWHPPLGTPGQVLSGGWIPLLNVLVAVVVALTFYGIYGLFEEGDIQ